MFFDIRLFVSLKVQQNLIILGIHFSFYCFIFIKKFLEA